MKIFKRIIFLVLLVALLWLIQYLWFSFPIITGYSAKMSCSCMYLGDRSLKSIQDEELGSFPLKLANITVNKDSSVEASILGMAVQTAFYRKGLGCTLVNERSIDEIRNQIIQIPAPQVLNADTINWPMGDQLPDSIPVSFNETSMQQAVQAAFTEKKPEEPMRTRAVVVLHKGALVAEQYAPGYDRFHRQLSWSMAKSITGTLIGMQVFDGKLQLENPAPVAAWKNQQDGREKISLRHLLQQTSGLDFEEDYSKSTDATNMLFRKADMAAYTAEHPLREPPGSRFYYSSGNTNILSGILRSTMGDSSYHAYPFTELFYKLGMYSVVFEPDASGTFVGSSYGFATPRDWARLGLLYQQKGMWMGQQVLPENWVKMAVQPVDVAPQGEYGFQFWLNAGAKNDPSDRRFPQLPADLYYMSGYQGQYVIIIPSRELVIVRLGQTGKPGWFDLQAFVNGILSALN